MANLVSKLYYGDNRLALKQLKDNSVHSVVTDPPYGLGKEPDPILMLKSWLRGETHIHKNKSGFMGKEWDSFVPQPDLWKECLRVLKPGGYCIAFFSTRTYDIGVLAMRIAGFEIITQVGWVFGTGFPKAHDIDKAVRKIKPKNKKFKGWKTALKPAFEPIIIARKPMSEKTYALNSLKHGVSGFNIDECRISINKNDNIYEKNPNTKGGFGHKNAIVYGKSKGSDKYDPSLGRFPSNLIHDGHSDVIEIFPTGKESASRFFYCAKASKSDRDEGLSISEKTYTFFQTKGGASGKASSISEGRKTAYKNNHPTVKPTALMQYLCRLVTPKGGIILDPFMGSGSTGKACMIDGFKFIGMEQDKSYFKIAYLRITNKANGKVKRIKV